MPIDRLEIIQAVTEAAYGTNPGPTATDALIVFNPEITVNSEFHNRAVTGNLIRPMRSGVVGQRSLGLTFSQELRGFGGGAFASDADIPQFHHLLNACGLLGTFDTDHWDYIAPDRFALGGADSSATIIYQQEELTWTITGCRGNAVMRFPIGMPAMIDYSFQGLYALPARAAMVDPDYTTGTTGLEDYAPQLVVGATLNFDPYGDAPGVGAYGHVSNVQIDLRNQIVPRRSSTLGTTGTGEFLITGRGSRDDPGLMVSFDVEMPSSTDQALWWTRWINQTLDVAANLTLTVGSGAGKVTVIELGGLFVKSCNSIRMDGDRFGHHIEAIALGTPTSSTEDDIKISCT